MSAMCRLIRKPEETLRTPDFSQSSMLRRTHVAQGSVPGAQRRLLTRAGAWLLLALAGLLAGCISGGGQHNGTGVNNQLIDLNGDVTVDNQPAGPNLNFTDGSTATLHFTISNIGDKPSDQLITITATLPAGLTYVSYASITSGNWTCSVSGQTITCTSSVSVAGLAMGIAIFDVALKVASTATGTAQLPVTISTPDGTPSSNSGAKGVIYSGVVSPHISGVNPTSGTGGTPVTITGSGFGATRGASSVVQFGGVNATATSWSDTSIVATVPTGLLEGPISIVVTVNTLASNTAGFTVTGPQITSLTPNSGPVGTPVTIAGTNFGSTQGSSSVKFNSIPATTVTTWSNTSIVADVPLGATTGGVAVTVAGISSNSPTFTVTSASGGCAAGGNAASLLAGDYAFSGQGLESTNEFEAVAGRFHADGVNTISGGLLDVNAASGRSGAYPLPFTGCFVLNTPAGASGDALGTLTIVGASGSQLLTLAIAIRTNGNGNFISSSVTPALSGALEKQCPNATNATCPVFANSNISGDYGFGFDGISAANATANFGVAGRLAADGSGHASAAVVDISSYAGVVALNDGFSASYNMSDTAHGLAQLTANITYNNGTASGQAVTLTFDCYLANVSSSGVAGVLYCVSSNVLTQPPVPVLQGRFSTQNTPAGGWTTTNAAPASNASVVWSTGIDGSGSPRVDVGQFTWNTSANPATISITQDQSKGGSYSYQQGVENISVASNGRTQTTASGTLTAVCYLLNPGSGFCIDEANNAALSTFVPQQAEPSGGFTTANFSNSFALGTLDPYLTINGGVPTADGVLTATGAAGTLSGTLNITTSTGLSSSPFAATYIIMSAADAPVGRFTVMETAPATDTLILYVIDANTAVAMSTTSTVPAVWYLKH